jgi:hypothetical protein
MVRLLIRAPITVHLCPAIRPNMAKDHLRIRVRVKIIISIRARVTTYINIRVMVMVILMVMVRLRYLPPHLFSEVVGMSGIFPESCVQYQDLLFTPFGTVIITRIMVKIRVKISLG